MQVCVIGGGPSGMMAAITARKKGHQVILLEKNDRLGKKILLTGNGRCNYTNLFTTPKHYNSLFVSDVLNQFGVEDTIHFFKDLGIEVLEEGEGRCYPASEQAQSITDVLTDELHRLGVSIKYNSEVLSIEKKQTFLITLKDEKIIANKVVIATGGMTYPLTGSNGDGYRFAKQFNHTITPLIPSLSRLKVKQDLRYIHGVRFKGLISVISDNQVIKQTNNDIIFSKSGLGGLGILEISKWANISLYQNKPTSIEVSLTNLDKDALKNRFKTLYYKTSFNSLIGLINKKLIPSVLKEAKIEADHYIKDLNPKAINNLIKTLKAFRFEVIDYYKEEAQVTHGGINLNEVHANTLESKLVGGLYFCGEVLDIDGDSGGFNLQWAFSSGYVCGL